MRSPNSHGAYCRRQISEIDRAVFGKPLSKPVLVTGPIEGTADHPKVLFAETHDGEVCLEPALLGEKGCVDRPANRPVALVDSKVLYEVDYTRPCEVEDGKSGDVEGDDPPSEFRDEVTQVSVAGEDNLFCDSQKFVTKLLFKIKD